MKTTYMMPNDRLIEIDQKTFSNPALCRALETIYMTNRRFRIWYGDTTTGRSWNEEYDTTGKVSTSTGKIACLILIKKVSSSAGPAILDSAIIRIDDIAARSTIYQHPKFHCTLKVVGLEIHDTHNNTVHARFDNQINADKYYDFMIGKRYNT